MGGFVIDTSEDAEGFLPNGTHTAILSPHGVRVMGRCAQHFLPNISKEQIQDKSKADPLVKSIVCLQTTWFCVQCVGRIASKLPISPLELNTLAHATCALIVYVLWWDKPVEVEQPLDSEAKRRTPCSLSWPLRTEKLDFRGKRSNQTLDLDMSNFRLQILLNILPRVPLGMHSDIYLSSSGRVN